MSIIEDIRENSFQESLTRFHPSLVEKCKKIVVSLDSDAPVSAKVLLLCELFTSAFMAGKQEAKEELKPKGFVYGIARGKDGYDPATGVDKETGNSDFDRCVPAKGTDSFERFPKWSDE